MADRTLARQIFVGRKAEQEEFHRLLRQVGPGYLIYHLYADGGSGKTRLLDWMTTEVQTLGRILSGAETVEVDSPLGQTAAALQARGLRRVCVTADLLDFFKTETRTTFGLLKDVARQLGPGQFEDFHRALAGYDQLIKTEIEPIQRNEKMGEVRQAFLEDYRAFVQDTAVVLLFDTFEAASWVGENLLSELLPTLNQNTLVVVAGRQRATFPAEARVHLSTLEPLSDADAIDFFRQRGLGEAVITTPQIKHINDLVGGRPIYLALAADWLADSEGTVEELIRLEPQEDLGRTLVRRILRLRTPEDRAILYLAIVWRSGELGLLAHLLGLAPDEMRALVDRLKRFSFIKYRPAASDFAGSCLLHDEMRDLVQWHCWREFDRTGQQQRALLQQALAYYSARLEFLGGQEVAAGRRRGTDRETRNCQTEWLYYQLRLDLDAGLQQLEPLFRDAAHYRDLAFCQQLLAELERPDFWNRLSESARAEYYFRQGLVMFRREKNDEAERWWSRVIGPQPVNPKMRATSLQLLTEMYGDLGQIDTGLAYAAQAAEAYQALLAQTPTSMLRRELGELYNNWGRLLRIKGQRTEAIQYYQLALKTYKDLPEAEVAKGRARTLNNLGFTYFELGNLDKAKTLCGLALQMRRRLDIKYELGLSYNTLGMVLEAADSWAEAADMYSKALTVFDEIQSGYGRGLVLINQGRMYRQVNNFDDAIAQLTDARRTFARLSNRNYLAQALNELGCAYRNRRGPGDGELALQCFDESIAQAEKYGGWWMVAQNLVDRALLFQRQGDREAARQSLARAGKVFELQNDLPLYSLSLWTAAKLAFEEGEALEAERQAAAAREQYLAAFTLFLESAATCVRNIRRGYQGRQAEWRYHRVLDEVQEKLHSRPPAEIPDYAERLKKEWQAKDLGEQFSDLITLCNDSLEALGYF